MNGLHSLGDLHKPMTSFVDIIESMNLNVLIEYGLNEKIEIEFDGSLMMQISTTYVVQQPYNSWLICGTL